MLTGYWQLPRQIITIIIIIIIIIIITQKISKCKNSVFENKENPIQEVP